MNNFKLAMAQIGSEKGNVAANTHSHIQALKYAAQHQVSLVVFPELSLTGYEPELAEELAFSPDDPRLLPLIKAAQEYHVYAVIGAPIKIAAGIVLGSFIISPTGNVSHYAKMNLHADENAVFSAGAEPKVIDINQHKIALAICADASDPAHIGKYAEQGVDAYVASVLISAAGYVEDTEVLASYAEQHHMLVAIANHNRTTGSWSATGKSAIWHASDQLVVADANEDVLLVAEKSADKWLSSVVKVHI